MSISLMTSSGKQNQPCHLISIIYGCYYPSLRAWDHHMVSSEFWRLYWNPQPGAELLWDGKTYPLDREHVILIPPFTVFSSRSSGDFAHFFLHFHATAPYDHIRKHIYSLPATALSAELEPVLDGETIQEQSWFRWLRLITAALLALPREAFLPATAPGHDPLIQRALELFQATPYSLSNEEICAKIGMSTSSFYLRFKRETGLTPARYQLNKRLERAAHMLLNDTYSLKSIAEATGFADRYHFSKAFKAKFYLTPIQFRHRNRPYSTP